MAQRNILIVDDDPKVREVLQQIFDAAGYPCRLVGDGGEALEGFKVWRPPLVVADLKMPGMSGIELLRQARAIDGDVAVLVLTGAADLKCLLASDGEQGLEAFRGSRPSLIVTDRRMPMVRGGERVADAGIQLLKQVRQEDPDAAVIVESGWADVKPKITSLKLGACAFITQPFLSEELLFAAERALERRQLLIERRRHQDRPARPSSEQGS